MAARWPLDGSVPGARGAPRLTFPWFAALADDCDVLVLLMRREVFHCSPPSEDRPGLLSWLLSLPRRATPLSLGGLIMGLVNLFGANLAAAALVSARRTNLGVGGGEMRPGIYGAGAQHSPGRIHRPPHRTGWTPVRDTALDFGVSSPAHCPPECLWRVIGQNRSGPVPRRFDRHRRELHRTLSLSRRSQCQSTRASEQCFRMHAGQRERSPS